MTSNLQGFMTLAAKAVANQGRGPWPAWPRRVGARTRPWGQTSMLAHDAYRHKRTANESCKPAAGSCKDRRYPAARIPQNHLPSEGSATAQVPVLVCYSRTPTPKYRRLTECRGKTHQGRLQDLQASCEVSPASQSCRQTPLAASYGCKDEVVA